MANLRRVLQNAATATGVGEAIGTKPYSTTRVQISGTFVGTITFQGRIDGTDWVAVQAINTSTGVAATTATTTGLYIVPSAGLMEVRANITAYTSGAITAVALAVKESPALPIDVDVVVGTSVDANLQVGDVDVSNANPVPVSDAGGALTVDGNVTTDSNGVTITQTPTVTAGAYIANDAVGGLLTFANAARASGGGGVIKNILIIDDAGQNVDLELWLFDTTFTAIADNGAWAPAEAELHTLIGVIRTTDSTAGWLDAGTPSVCQCEVSLRYDCTGTSLFGQLVTRGTPTFAATDDITVRIELLQD